MADGIYEQFDRATGGISAFALLKDGEPVGRVVVRRKTAVSVYFQIWGLRMEKGQARGGGYDMASAAVEDAAFKLDPGPTPSAASAHVELVKRFILDRAREGQDWTRRLEAAGYSLAVVI